MYITGQRQKLFLFYHGNSLLSGCFCCLLKIKLFLYRYNKNIISPGLPLSHQCFKDLFRVFSKYFRYILTAHSRIRLVCMTLIGYLLPIKNPHHICFIFLFHIIISFTRIRFYILTISIESLFSMIFKADILRYHITISEMIFIIRHIQDLQTGHQHSLHLSEQDNQSW